MSGSDWVTLKGGLVVPVPFLRRLWALEERGVRFRLDAEDVLVGPTRLLDDADLQYLRQLKALLVSVLSGGEVTA